MRPFPAVCALAVLAACSSDPRPLATEVADAAKAPETPTTSCEPKPPDPKRFPLDPVELRRGREVPGSDDRVEQSGAFSYAFASAENQAAFRADPAQYEVQLGGACARMGPLSGGGNVTLFALHDDKLYLFASKACRAAFLKAPEKYLVVDDPRPGALDATEDARARGKEALDRALIWMGGAEAVDSVRTLRERDEKAGDRTYHVKHELQIDFARGWARENECWDASCFGNVIGRNGAFSTGEQSTPLVPVQRSAFDRQVHAGVLATLRRRHAPDAVVFLSGGGSSISDLPSGSTAASTGDSFDVVTIWSAGAETRVHVRKDGAILTLEHGSRHGTGRWRGAVDFDDWRPCGPIRLPYARVVWSGESDRRMAETFSLTSIEVDRPLDPALFDG